MLNIRLASTSDAPHIADLLRQLGYSASVELVLEKLTLLSANSMDRILVAEHQEKVVGLIALHVLELFHTAGRLGRITSLVIDADHRGSGVGKLLIQEADEYFVENGCVRAEVTSGEGLLARSTTRGWVR